MRMLLQSAAPEPAEQACLDGFRALSEEVRRAILAIAANDPVSLAESVAAQAARAAGLQGSLARFERAASPSKLTRARMLRSANELAALNEEYAALTAHSGESLRLLAALHSCAEPGGAGHSWQA